MRNMPFLIVIKLRSPYASPTWLLMGLREQMEELQKYRNFGLIWKTQLFLRKQFHFVKDYKLSTCVKYPNWAMLFF